MLPNIIEHSKQVANVALAIYNNLITKDSLDKNIILAAALLHDIAKTASIKEGQMRHDLKGGEILRNLGFKEIALIVESHVFFKGYNPFGPITEKEIIFYADKRVKHDQIVPVKERAADLVKRYGKDENRTAMINKNKLFTLELEKKIQKYSILDLDQYFSKIFSK